MALPITISADYDGFTRITTSKSTSLDTYITQYEVEYLRNMLGDEAYNDILTQDPLDQKYIDLIDGVNYTDENGDFQAYQGLKDALIRFIYFHYAIDNFQTSVAGNVYSNNENSTPATNAQNSEIAKRRYHKAIEIYCNEVLWFLINHKDLEQTITGSTDNGGSYTINVTSTKYLANGSTVTIGGTDYVISLLVADTSFLITESDGGLDFTDELVKYKPFYDVVPYKFDYICL